MDGRRVRACDTTPNLLYHNNHDGTLPKSQTAGVAYSEEGSMQAVWAPPRATTRTMAIRIL